MVARLFGACGDADARRGWQASRTGCRMVISGRTCGDAGVKRFCFSCKGPKPAATQGLPRGKEWASPRRKGTIRLFLSPPSFFFTHEKERRGAGCLTGTTSPRGHTPHTNAIPDRVILPCRAIGEPPARVPRRKTSHRDVLRPSCAFLGEGFRVPRDAAERQIAMPPSTRITSPVI